MRISKLFEPIEIGSMRLKNRIVFEPHFAALESEDGAVTDRLIDYHVARAKGGVGLIVAGSAVVDVPQGKGHPFHLSVDHDKYITGLNALAESVHEYGTNLALQLRHSGRQTTLVATEGLQPVTASDCILPPKLYVPAGEKPKTVRARALEVEEIKVLVEKFAESARRCFSAGLDAIMIDGANGHLIADFLSPYVNRRTDEYGGSVEKRMKFALEIIDQIREKVGDCFPIIFRLSIDEYVEGGNTLVETKRIAKHLEKASVNIIDASAGRRESAIWMVPPMSMPRGCLVHLAEGIKSVVDIPVVALGRITDPMLAEKILLEGKADLIGMCRALIADPEWPNKAEEGKLKDIRVCTSCCEGCNGRTQVHRRIGCTINAMVGKEGDIQIIPTTKPKRILVVGGGPAGMEAARVSALRGHEVILCEKASALGGQLKLSASVPHKEELKNELEYLTYQLGKLGVEVKPHTQVDLQLVRKINPEAVIIATGADPYVPEIPGVNQKNVVNAWDVLAGKVEVGNRVVVAGGGCVGCETAELLVEKGKSVTVIEMLEEVATDMEPRHRVLLLQRLNEKGVRILTCTRIVRIKGKVVEVVDRDMKRQNVATDNIVLALGAISNRELYTTLEGKLPKLLAVGDCVKPRKTIDAIREGFQAALRL